MSDERAFPTMIIPKGTQITVNDSGQLAIRTPGNLVIQNSGAYSVIECGSGSVRIDPEVKVEAVSIHAADTCSIGGSLTAWRVKAKKVVLDKGAQAFIMLRDSESLEMDRQARLVGNFASEQELYLFMGRFNAELRSLSQALSPGEPAVTLGTGANQPGGAARSASAPPTRPLREEPFGMPPPSATRPEVMADLEAAITEELRRPDLPAEARQALASLQQIVQSGEIDQVRGSYASLLARVPSPSPRLLGARRRLEAFLAADSPWPEANA